MHIIINGRREEVRALWREGRRINFIDQRKLPFSFEIYIASDTEGVASAIREMIVRGAPAIGCAAAFGMALAWENGMNIDKAAELLKSTRPTAFDLSYAVQWMIEMAPGLGAMEAAERYTEEIVQKCRRIGEFGASLIKDGDRILTHCNAGALATVDYGTALSPMRVAFEQGKDIFVYVDETRPWLQGSRLTAWELSGEGIPHAVIADNAAGHFLKRDVDLVIVGADRIALNGDFANKIGTYEKAVVAKENGVPFYTAAPLSTFDPSIASGDTIRIEERSSEELRSLGGTRVFPETEEVLNPVFDVTPFGYVTGFITETGIVKPTSIPDTLKRAGIRR
ncbi:MAG: S-methyl-5-thioribose-1-phosphate isomerase [Methanomassiliicoccales archaeon]